MAYLLDLWTPKTWQAFRDTDGSITGFREWHQHLANERVNKGDIFLCYLTRLSRWCGVLRVESVPYYDNSPVHDDLASFPIHVRVTPCVMLEPEIAVPIKDDAVWNALTITNQYKNEHSYWSGFFRTSLNIFKEEDGSYLVELLKRQQSNPRSYPLSLKDKRELKKIGLEPDPGGNGTGIRESIRIQAQIAQIGAEMGFRIWVPRGDRARVLEHIPTGMRKKFLDELPLNYDDTTLKTVEQIDVLWLKGRSMTRAFEIEHTTAIYSGLLRMADLLALQPNMDIRLHIVAPEGKQDKVLREIKRPVFSQLARPLYEQCSFLSYDSIRSLGELPHLSYTSHMIIADYEEWAEV